MSSDMQDQLTDDDLLDLYLGGATTAAEQARKSPDRLAEQIHELNPDEAEPLTVARRIIRLGRPPAAGTQRQVRLSVTIPPEYAIWLRSQGNVSAVTRALIKTAMALRQSDDSPNLPAAQEA